MVTDRIIRALQSGPLYEGAIPLVVGGTVANVDKALHALRREGLIERTPGDPYQWRVKS